SGLLHFQDSLFVRYTTSDGLNSNRITALAQDSSGHIWAATMNNGISILRLPRDTSNGTGDSLNLLPSIYVPIKIPILPRPIFERLGKQDGLPDLRISCLRLDTKGQMWVGTRNGGVAVFAERRLIKTLDQRNGLPDNNVRVIEMDESGRAWIGTASGGLVSVLLEADSLQLHSFQATDGLTSNQVNQIVFSDPQRSPDGSQDIWVGSYQGVDRISLDAERQFKEVQHYDMAEGFTGRETTPNAALRDALGRLWFGTTNGLMQYTPGSARTNRVPPTLHLRDVQLGYQSLRQTAFKEWISSWGKLKDGLTLPYRSNDLSFEFIGINHNNPQSVRYSWKLENHDTEWSPLSTRNSERYSSLAPNDYVFKVRAFNENGIANDPPLTVRFSITPPWWQTWWFRIGSVLLGIFLIAGFTRLRVNRIRRKERRQREQLELEKNMIELEQKALQLQMNPHFIFNALNSIQGLIAKKEPAKARFQLAKFAKLMRSILENSRSESISLESEMELLDNYMTVENNGRLRPFTYRFEVDERIDPEEVQLPPMMLQPFVENAIIHGIQTVEQGHILIRFQPKGKLLECIIEDNGIGLTAAKQRKSQVDQQHKSAALQVTRERLALLQKEALGKQKGMEIEEIIATDGRVAGTRVTLRVPLG
ncbi:MAG: histidine kinase, partial [Bacteroidota bacterium]